MTTVQMRESFLGSDVAPHSPEALRELQSRRFARLMERVLARNPFYSAKLKSAGICSALPLKRLAEIPFTVKSEIAADQAAHPPFGSNLSSPVQTFIRMHQTSGTTGVPIRWLDDAESWESWMRQWRAVYGAAGVRAGDKVYVAFSFGPFIGFWTAFEAAQTLGCLAITGGGQTTEQRLASIAQLRPTVLVCTPTYALRLAEAAEAQGLKTAALGIRISVHAGEPGAGIPATRNQIQTAWGCKAYDHVGMTEMGAYGFECQEQLGPHVNESEFILEVIDPKTNRPAVEGEVGEIVLTNLCRLGSPLIRYRTGDLARAVRGRCACGRIYARLQNGLLGRTDDMITVRGINVFPTAIENILRRFPEIVEFQGDVITEREMQELLLRLETRGLSLEEQKAFADRVVSEMRIALNLRPRVEFVADGTLPRAEMKSRRFRLPSARGSSDMTQSNVH